MGLVEQTHSGTIRRRVAHKCKDTASDRFGIPLAGRAMRTKELSKEMVMDQSIRRRRIPGIIWHILAYLLDMHLSIQVRITKAPGATPMLRFHLWGMGNKIHFITSHVVIRVMAGMI